MKQVTMQTVQNTQSGTAATRLAEIQQQIFDLCVPKSGAQYDEFYKVTTERGFTCITLPTGKN
ncbi:MAG: hypothetical protein Q8K65_04145 [Alphaproteobacteria bacterium]|nr:hypothetical protein [Alphaproteobacteria bacterium]